MPAVQSAYAASDVTGLDSAFVLQVAAGRPPWGARIARFREVEAQLPEIIDRVIIQGQPVADAAREIARRIDGILAR
jgi:hypothetical protein